MTLNLVINGKSIDLLTQGNADSQHILLTIGPGSLYFPIYSQNLQDKLFFIAFDGNWICKKGSTVNISAIEALTLDNMVAEIAAVITALKTQFPNKHIHLLANSVVTGLALVCAQRLPQLINSTICIGTPLKPIDSQFSHVKDLPLDDAKKEQLSQDLKQYEAMMQGERLNECMSDSNVRDGRLTPVSAFVEQCKSLNILTLHDAPHYSATVLAMWRHAPTQPTQVLNLAMRNHFFTQVQPAINICETIQNLDNANANNVLLIWGREDGITLYNLDFLESRQHVRYTLFENAGHFPQLEASAAFDKILCSFTGLEAQSTFQLKKVSS